MMDFSKIQVPLAHPRPDRKSRRWSRCWKDVRKRVKQYRVVPIAA